MHPLCVLCFGKRHLVVLIMLSPSISLWKPTIISPLSILCYMPLYYAQKHKTLVSKCHSASRASHNIGQHGSAVPGWQASLVCTQSSYQWTVSSSHSARSVFTGLFWSRGRTSLSPRPIGWKGCCLVRPGESEDVCVGGESLTKKALYSFDNGLWKGMGPKTHMHTHVL